MLPPLSSILYAVPYSCPHHCWPLFIIIIIVIIIVVVLWERQCWALSWCSRDCVRWANCRLLYNHTKSVACLVFKQLWLSLCRYPGNVTRSHSGPSNGVIFLRPCWSIGGQSGRLLGFSWTHWPSFCFARSIQRFIHRDTNFIIGDLPNKHCLHPWWIVLAHAAVRFLLFTGVCLHRHLPISPRSPSHTRTVPPGAAILSEVIASLINLGTWKNRECTPSYPIALISILTVPMSSSVAGMQPNTQW